MKILVFIFAAFYGISFCQPLKDLSLEQLLTKEEQDLIGLSKLTDLEQENLRLLIIEKYLLGFNEAEQKTTEDKGKKDCKEKGTEIISSRVKGGFHGWDGETIVKLRNGQTWKQIGFYFHPQYLYMPKVKIYKSDSGFMMDIEGTKKTVKVRRVF